ncbi:MAG: glucose 1-dehydrogenase [Actinomycetota bacterium]
MIPAWTVEPGIAGSARIERLDEPPGTGEMLVEALAVGICGTDREILAGEFGKAPPGRRRIVLGHESLGRAVDAPSGSGFWPGDLVAGIVRRPDPVPCPACAADEWDMCGNGLYTERGIKGLDGYAAERWRIEPHFAVRVDRRLGETGVLLEPASIAAKAWEHIDRIGARSSWSPTRVLVTGAGPLGLLAALLGKQRGLEVHVLDRVTSGPKPALARDLGATYHTGSVEDACPNADIVVECTGAAEVVMQAVASTAPNGIVCLTGVSSGSRTVRIDASALNNSLVLENDVVFGSVNANRRHYEAAHRALLDADPGWLGRCITRRLPSTDWLEAVGSAPDDVKVILTFPGLSAP